MLFIGVSSPRQPVVMMSSERGGEAVPECPVDVTAQPSVNGGLIVFWRPVRCVCVCVCKKMKRENTVMSVCCVAVTVVGG